MEVETDRPTDGEANMQWKECVPMTKEMAKRKKEEGRRKKEKGR